jgi:DNA repair protein RecO (recombination protein O)
MPTYRTEAIILKRRNFSEADKILTVFTQKKGKISVIAKGARRLKSRKGGNLDLLNYCQLLIAKGKNLDLIVEVQAINSFLPLKKDLGKIGLSYLACEIVDLLNAERVENHLLFKYLNEFLESLSAEGDKLKQKLLSVGFQFKVIDLLGFFSETLITSENDLVIIKKLIARDFNQMAYLDVDKVSFDKLELIAAKLFEEIAEKKSKSRNFFNLIQRQ